MNNQKGEATLFCVLILVALSGLLTLCSLELQHTYLRMQKRTELLLCVKETKGEMKLFLMKMGRLNWVLKNSKKAQLAAILLPPLWPYIGHFQKLRDFVKTWQAVSLGSYFVKFNSLRSRGCPIDPQMLLSPYQLGADYGFQRSHDGAAKLRKKRWTYLFLKKPYLLTLKIDASKSERLEPEVSFQAEEKLGTLSSLLSSR